MSKHLTRRDFVHAGCAIVGASLAPTAFDRAEAALRLHGSAQAVVPTGFSQRNVLNLNAFSVITNDYAYIDHVKAGTSCIGPVGSAYSSGGTPWPGLIDANGWKNSNASTGDFGGGWQIPDPTNFGGPYTMDWVGNGAWIINILGGTGVWTATSPVNCSVTFNSGGSLQVTSTGGASTASIQISLTSNLTGPQAIQFKVQNTGTGGFFIKNVRFYRTADATDLAAGKIFRSAWKQPIVNLCPSAIRFMNILGGNGDRNCRFENRTLPSFAGYTYGSQWSVSPYYQTDATGTNQYVVAAANGTANPSNPKTTPASMVQGEMATIRIPNGTVRGSSQLAVSSVTNAANGVVTTASPHGYSTGDLIAHWCPLIANISGNLNGTTTVTGLPGGNAVVNGMGVYGPGIPANTTVVSGGGTSTIVISNAATLTAGVGLAFRTMPKLHQLPCTITVTGTTTYQLNVNTTGFGAFSSSPQVNSYTFITLQVGSGNDRTAYPVAFPDGNTPVTFFGDGFIASNTYKTMYFDKTVSAQTDGSGNPVLGVWMTDATSSSNGHSGDFPIEHCVALINELNAMSPAHTIGMWMNMPTWGLSSMDPDYTTASDWALNAIDVVMNPSSSVRASGYSALGYSGASQLNQPILVIEYSNELWPSGTNDGRAYLIQRSFGRWPAIVPYQDWQDLKALRSTLFARAIKAANPPGLSRIKFTIGIQGTVGLQSGTSNYFTVFGGNTTANPVQTGDWYTNDTLVTTGSWGRPIDNHDAVSPASYFNPPDIYYNGLIGTGSFVDDSAMYNGTNNSAATISWTATISGTTMTVTGSPTAPVNIGQLFTGPGVTAGSQVIGNAFSDVGFTGTGGAGTYKLNKSSTVASSATMSNTGGNYTGAANQSQAITNLIAINVDVNNIYGGESTTRYATIVYPQISAALPSGKVCLSYEGGTNWVAQNTTSEGGHTLTLADTLFSIAAINSSQWATAQTSFFNAVCALSNVFMPSIYTWIGAQDGSGNPSQRWAYCSPDSYATITGTPTEGAALTVNSPVWIAMGNRNQALPS